MSTTTSPTAARWEALFFAVTKFLAVCSAFFVMLLMLYIVADVFGRYAFNHPLPNSLAVSETLMVCLAFLGLAYVQAKKMNIRLDFVTSRLGPLGVAVHELLSDLVNAAVIGLILWASASWVWESWVIKDAMQGPFPIPFYYSKTPMFVGLVFLFLQYLIDLGKSIHELRRAMPNAKGRGN